ncbi:MAG: NYN domain-containing protein [Oscillospiraceae bacterium]|jgi:hypothetical protein|nr:NYN domain-containing protein [Oscillospiraceae bacterium]
MVYNTAIFYDVENLVGGYAYQIAKPEEVNLQLIVERIRNADDEISAIAAQRAYGDWSITNMANLRKDLLENGIDPIQVFTLPNAVGGKDVADIQMTVDIMETAVRNENIKVFVIVSGDGGFASLARKLHEYGKKVIGCSYAQTASQYLRPVCDKFILLSAPEAAQPAPTDGGIDLKAETIALTKAEIDASWKHQTVPPQIKGKLKSKIPGFDEGKLGYSRFHDFLNAMYEDSMYEIVAGPGTTPIIIRKDDYGTEHGEKHPAPPSAAAAAPEDSPENHSTAPTVRPVASKPAPLYADEREKIHSDIDTIEKQMGWRKPEMERSFVDLQESYYRTVAFKPDGVQTFQDLLEFCKDSGDHVQGLYYYLVVLTRLYIIQAEFNAGAPLFDRVIEAINPTTDLRGKLRAYIYNTATKFTLSFIAAEKLCEMWGI